jgi:hypothetical protein
MAGISLKAALTSLLLALAIEAPVLAQTIKPVDDGTVLKDMIIFGRHSIRAPTTETNGLNAFSASPYPDFVGVWSLDILVPDSRPRMT